VDGNPSYTINAEEHYLEVTNMDANNWWTGKGFHSRTNIAFPSSYIVEDAYSSSGALIMHKSDVASEIFGALFIIDDSSWDGNNVGVAHGNIQDNWAADAYYYKGAGVGENADWYSGEIAGAVGTWYSLQTRIWKLAGNIKVDTDGTVRVDEANTQTPNRVHLGINRYSTYGFGTERFYAFKIRKYVSPEPQHGAWGSIEINGTITVGNTALVTGYASKNTTITSSANPIIRVLSNFVPYDNTLRSPLIENIVLQGVNGNETAILLDDVYNCQIRNVTIKNCGIGINLRNASHWTEATHIKHVRMTDVTKGIVFERYSGGEEQRSFAFTHIEDVGIALKDAANCIGIEVGPACKPYSSFIKANVWLTNANNNIGLDVKNNGEVKYGLVNLYVANVSGVGSRGIGVNIDTANGGIVEKNQGPLLLTAFRLYRSVLPEGYSNDLIKRVEIT
jgi:hypothetical protein